MTRLVWLVLARRVAVRAELDPTDPRWPRLLAHYRQQAATYRTERKLA